MTKLPYTFKTPIPNFFWESGFLNPEEGDYFCKKLAFLTWAFAKCSSEPHSAFTICKVIHYAPFEFACGRISGAKESGLTENEWRNQRNCHLNNFYLEKTTNSLTNQFNCYRWTEMVFYKNDNQRNNQRVTNESPTRHHNIRTIDLQTIEQQQQEKEEKQAAPASVVVVFSFKNSGFNEDEVEDILSIKGVKFTQERIDKAIAFINHPNYVPIKGRVATIKWHLRKKIPPEHSQDEENNSQEKKLAYEYAKKAKDLGFPEYENKINLQENRMEIWLNGGNMSISLNNLAKELKKDFNQSLRELELRSTSDNICGVKFQIPEKPKK